MARKPLNALQAILIRERLITCFEHRKSDRKKYNVRLLIEDIAQSDGNEGESHAYRESQDDEDEGEGGRFDSGLTLKHSTVDNLLNRRSSAISDDNLRLIRNFLLTEGYLTADALTLCGQHPDLRLQPQFGGIAPTDARLQRYRRALEGEYRFSKGPQALWIAAPGRSQPFVSLRAVAATTRSGDPFHQTAFSKSSERYEGRLFLMPGESVALVELRTFDKTWDGAIYRVATSDNSLELLNDLTGSRSYVRTASAVLATGSDGLRGALRQALARLRFRWQACRERDRRILKSFRQMWAPRSADTRPATLTAKDADLIEAAKSGQAYRLIQLLAEGANINAVDPATRRTATHLAAASNSLASVFALACRQGDEEWVLKEHFPDMDPHGDVAKRWRSALHWRYSLVTDDEGCFASALAPASTDNSVRNRIATTIWLYLMLIEAEHVEAHWKLPRSAFLEVWKPSSVMIDALQRYAAPLPAGFTDLKPD